MTMKEEISNLPKLKVKFWVCGHVREDIRDFEAAINYLNINPNSFVAVDGQIYSSCDELIRMAKQGSFKNREFLEMELLPLALGG